MNKTTAQILDILTFASSLLGGVTALVPIFAGLIAMFRKEDPAKVWTQEEIDAKVAEFMARQDVLDERFQGEDIEDE